MDHGGAKPWVLYLVTWVASWHHSPPGLGTSFRAALAGTELRTIPPLGNELSPAPKGAGGFLGLWLFPTHPLPPGTFGVQLQARVMKQALPVPPLPRQGTSLALSSPPGPSLKADISFHHAATTLHDREKISVARLICSQTFINTATNSLGKWKINFYTTWRQAVD